MATTRLSDIIDVTVFEDLPQINGPEKTALFQSGIILRNGLLDTLAGSAGKVAELPFWNDLDGSIEVNYSDDNPANTATPQKIVQGEQITRKAFVNQGWQAADLASELALGGTAMEAIRAKTDMYFQRQFQRRLIASSNGVLADNVANDSSDMVIDVASESIAGQTSSTLFNRDAFTEAVYTAGDAADMFRTIVVHSVVMAQMVKNDDIVFIPNSKGELVIPTYMGLRVVTDDGLTVTAGSTDGFKYTSLIFGENAFGFGVGNAEVPTEIEREAAQGNGGGIETLWMRKTWILHPFGFQTLTTPAAESFTQAELSTAAVWDRVVDRKLVPLSYLITN